MSNGVTRVDVTPNGETAVNTASDTKQPPLWCRTSREVIHPTLTLPSLAPVPSVPLFERLSLSSQGTPRPSPLDYVIPNEEQVLRQAALNNQVRDLVKHAPKVPSKPLDAAPEFIALPAPSAPAPPPSETHSAPPEIETTSRKRRRTASPSVRQQREDRAAVSLPPPPVYVRQASDRRHQSSYPGIHHGWNS